MNPQQSLFGSVTKEGSNLSFSDAIRQRHLEDYRPEDLADEGINRASDAVSTEWKEEALNALRSNLEVRLTVTADDLESYSNPEHPNAMGGIFREAAKRGWCRFSGQYKASTIPRKHGRMLRIWESLLKDSNMRHNT